MGIVEVNNESSRKFEPMDIQSDHDETLQEANIQRHFEPLQMEDAEPETPEEEQKRIDAELEDFAKHACKISKYLLTAALVVFAIVYFKFRAAVAAGEEADTDYMYEMESKTTASNSLASVLDSIGLQPKLHGTPLHDSTATPTGT